MSADDRPTASSPHDPPRHGAAFEGGAVTATSTPRCHPTATARVAAESHSRLTCRAARSADMLRAGLEPTADTCG